MVSLGKGLLSVRLLRLPAQAGSLTLLAMTIGVFMIRISRLLKSYSYAIKGLFKTFREEQNLRIQSLAGLAVLILGIYFSLSRIEWAILTLAVCLVLTAEITNSAVERVTDVLKPRINTYVKEIKDIMAAAVLLSSIAALITGLIIFFPYVYKMLGH